MCGHFGFSRLTPNTEKLIPTLAIAMEQRGHDSWGVTDGVELVKCNSAITKSFWHYPQLLTPSWHTRAASYGAVSQRNAHPFQYVSERTGITVVGMHNGHIHNHFELEHKYKEQRKEFQVDSEHIFAHLAEKLPLAELEGYGAVVWWEYPTGKPEDRKRYISCFNNPAMFVAKLATGEIVYASSQEAVETAARLAGNHCSTWFDIKQRMLYRLGDDDNLYNCGPYAWREPIIAGGGGGSKTDKHCISRQCFREVERPGWVFCSFCIKEVRVDLGLDTPDYTEAGLVYGVQ